MIRLTILFIFIAALSAYAQEIALTFDDAPTGDGPMLSGEERTGKILAALKQHDVEEAAFFVLTNGITQESAKRLNDYAAAGHLLANHSHGHLWIHEVGSLAYIRDVATADSILQNFQGYTKWFRYPYLNEGRTAAARDSIRAALDELELKNGYVTVDNYDWYLNHLLRLAITENRKVNMQALRRLYIDHIYQSIQFYDAIARKHLGRSPKHVLLLHENDIAALFLGDLIQHLKSMGWKIISPRQAYNDPIATEVPDVLFNGQGRVAAIARERGVPARELVQEAEDEAYLDELVKTQKIFE